MYIYIYISHGNVDTLNSSDKEMQVPFGVFTDSGGFRVILAVPSGCVRIRCVNIGCVKNGCIQS